MPVAAFEMLKVLFVFDVAVTVKVLAAAVIETSPWPEPMVRPVLPSSAAVSHCW